MKKAPNIIGAAPAWHMVPYRFYYASRQFIHIHIVGKHAYTDNGAAVKH